MALRFRGLDAPIEVVYCKSSGSAPQPVDPYQQAAAQYGLSTGTALFNAGLNRTNVSNPVGSSTWTSTPAPTPPPSDTANTQPIQFPGMPYGLGGLPINLPSTTTSQLAQPPTYSQSTQLQPWANQMLQSPIDTSGIAGMPGGPSTTQDLTDTRNALYNQQEAYIQPEQKLQSEQLQSQLANEGLMPGSAAYNNEMDRLSREQTFTNNQAENSAITGAGAEQSRLFGLGAQSLQNQLAVRNTPISEYEALLGNSGAANASALTPDISGAFNQAYQGQLAGYNANTASNNATTGEVGSLLGSLLMYMALA